MMPQMYFIKLFPETQCSFDVISVCGRELHNKEEMPTNPSDKNSGMKRQTIKKFGAVKFSAWHFHFAYDLEFAIKASSYWK